MNLHTLLTHPLVHANPPETAEVIPEDQEVVLLPSSVQLQVDYNEPAEFHLVRYVDGRGLVHQGWVPESFLLF